MPNISTTEPPTKKVKKKVVKKVVKKKRESVTQEVSKQKKIEIADEKPLITETVVENAKSIDTNKEVETIGNPNESVKEECSVPKADTGPAAKSTSPTTEASIIEKPEDISTTESVEVVARIKTRRADLLHTKHVTWIKGKWNELTKGDRFDTWSNELTGEHFLKFRCPKQADSGLYRVKAVSQTGEEECTFQLIVGPPIVEDHKIEIKKGYIPSEKEVERDVDFRNRLKRVLKVTSSNNWSERLKSDDSASSNKLDVWSLLKNASTREYDAIAFKFGIVDMRGMLRRLSQASKFGNKKLPSFTKKLPSTLSTNLNEKVILEVEVTNEQMTVKWQKNGEEITPGKQYQIVTKENKRFLVIEQAAKDDDAIFSCLVGKDITSCELFVQMPPVTLIHGFQDVQLNNGEDAEFNAEMSSDVARYRILRDGSEILQNDRFKVKKDGPKVTLQILNCQAEDEGFYLFMVNGGRSCAELMVQTDVAIVRPFSDLKVNFKDTAEFFCEVSKEDAKGKWLKDGEPLNPNDRIKVTESGKARKLVINQVQDSDQGEYSFVADEHPTCSITAALEMTGGRVTVEKKKTPPSIYLDHSLKDRAIVVRAGHKLKLDIPISGEPAPVPEWKKGPKDGKQITLLETEQRVWVTTSKEQTNTALTIANAQTVDSDDYYCELTWDKGIQEGADSEYIKRQLIQFKVRVSDIPDSPSVPKITNVTAETCYVQWKEPPSDGGCSIRGYMVERKKTKSERWIRLNVEPLPFNEYEARRMIEGTEYQIRVRAVNEVGYSEPSQPSVPFTPLAPCSVPSGFRVSASTDESLELSWLPPLEIGAAGIDGYKLELQMLGSKEEPWKNVEKNSGLLPHQITKYVVNKLVTGKKYRFRLSAINKAGPSEIAEFGPVVCAAVVEDPKILLPRHLLKPVKVKVGAKLHVNVPYQGRPKPQLKWTKEGKDLEDHVAVRNSLDSSVLFIRKAERWDSGFYELQLKVGDEEINAKIEVAVIDKPSKPRQVKLLEVLGNSASLKWEEPSDSGNTDILGYVVEKRDARSDEWYVVYDKLRHKQCQVSDLVLGNNYLFRIKAFNEVGFGEANGTKDSANIPKEKTEYKKPDYVPMDFRIKPEFTQLLNSRRIVENYNGTLSCSLKCNPRPKIRWFKNKTEIIDNPKYKMTQAMGIIQLEIRRARAGDAGTYTVIASNEMGDATCSAEVTVKEIKTQG